MGNQIIITIIIEALLGPSWGGGGGYAHVHTCMFYVWNSKPIISPIEHNLDYVPNDILLYLPLSLLLLQF